MFNMGFSEIVVIAVVALIFIGPKQLPEVARVVGRLLNEFKRATGDITGSFVKMRDDADQVLRQTKDDLLDQMSAPEDRGEPKKEDRSFVPEPTEMAGDTNSDSEKKDPSDV